MEQDFSISVIVPAYNAAPTIEKCVDSILSQDFDGYELVVVDDGSNDGTSELLDDMAAHDSKVRVIHQPNSGRCNARNTGIDAAVGEWICFCDADDELCQDALRMLHNCVKCGADLVIGGYTDCPDIHVAVEAEHAIIVELDRGDVARGLVQTQDLQVTEGGLTVRIEDILFRSVWGKLYRRSLLVEKGLRFREGIRYGEDALFNIDFLASSGGRIVVTSHPVYHYNRIVGSTTRAFSEVDAKALLPFLSASVDSISNASKDQSLGIVPYDANRFVGHEVSATVIRAARYGGGPVVTARILKDSLSDEGVLRCWQATSIASVGLRGMRTIQIALIRSGRTTAAMAMLTAYVRLRDFVRKDKTLQFRS